MQEKNKKIGRFVIIMDQLLGRGSFGNTYKSYLSATRDKVYACKIISKNQIHCQHSTDYFVRRVKDEFKALQSLKHPNIVSLQDFQQTKNNLYIFMHYCQDNLQDYIAKHIFDKDHQQINKFAQEIVSACRYFCAQGVLHRDIKPANILISKGNIKIADFGLAKFIKSQNQFNIATYAGTPHYMAPQIMRQNPRLREIMKCDIWSVGVTLYELAKGYLPFEMHKKEKSAKILLDRINSASKGLPRVEENPLIERLVQGMLVVDPAERMSFEQAYMVIQKYKKDNLQGKQLQDVNDNDDNNCIHKTKYENGNSQQHGLKDKYPYTHAHEEGNQMQGKTRDKL